MPSIFKASTKSKREFSITVPDMRKQGEISSLEVGTDPNSESTRGDRSYTLYSIDWFDFPSKIDKWKVINVFAMSLLLDFWITGTSRREVAKLGVGTGFASFGPSFTKLLTVTPKIEDSYRVSIATLTTSTWRAKRKSSPNTPYYLPWFLGGISCKVETSLRSHLALVNCWGWWQQ